MRTECESFRGDLGRVWTCLPNINTLKHLANCESFRAVVLCPNNATHKFKRLEICSIIEQNINWLFANAYWDLRDILYVSCTCVWVARKIQRMWKTERPWRHSTSKSKGNDENVSQIVWKDHQLSVRGCWQRHYMKNSASGSQYVRSSCQGILTPKHKELTFCEISSISGNFWANNASSHWNILHNHHL